MKPIAIVGIGIKTAKAENVNSFWKLLKENKNTIEEIPESRWSASFYARDKHTSGKTNSKWGGLISSIELFDAPFFKISREEASKMDPQHRMLLEVVYEALQDGGISLDKIKGTQTGVWVGLMNDDYTNMVNYSEVDLLNKDSMNTRFMASNRISYVYDLRGPSVTIDTACSSSLVALHLAVQSLQLGECDLAIVGAANLLIKPHSYICASQIGMLSVDGLCKSLDSLLLERPGYVRSEGVTVVILKRLEDCCCSSHEEYKVYASIVGSAVNNNGSTAKTLTFPSSKAQIQLMNNLYHKIKIDPGVVQYVEAHAPGTLGDLVEVEALASVFNTDSRNNPLRIGSVKSQLGHLESASGLVGLIKVALMLHNKMLLPHLIYSSPLQMIEEKKMQIQQKYEPFLQDGEEGLPIFAGVNSFGAGGTNAHVILQSQEILQQRSTDNNSNCNNNDESYNFLFFFSVNITYYCKKPGIITANGQNVL